MASSTKEQSRPWRTNLGLRLTDEVGEWFMRKCEEENRAYSNYIETLLIREYRKDTPND